MRPSKGGLYSCMGGVCLTSRDKNNRTCFMKLSEINSSLSPSSWPWRLRSRGSPFQDLVFAFEDGDLRPPRWFLLEFGNPNQDDILRVGWWRPSEHVPLSLRYGEVWDSNGASPTTYFGLIPRAFLAPVWSTARRRKGLYRLGHNYFRVTNSSFIATGFLPATLFLLLLIVIDLRNVNKLVSDVCIGCELYVICDDDWSWRIIVRH